jgi:multiple sugar transport system substrate-binding protein
METWDLNVQGRRNEMKRTVLKVLAILLVTALALAACQGKSGSASPAGKQGQAKAFDWKRYSGQEITLLLNEHPWTEGVRPLVKTFEDLTGIKVNVQAFAEDLYYDKAELALRSEKPVADVFFLSMDSVGFAQWKANLLAPLTPYLADPSMTSADYDIADYPEGFRVGASYPLNEPSTRLYGIPITFETYILFYNKDLVAKYLGGKTPQTMQELIADAKKITQEGKGQVYGSVVRGIRSDTIMDTFTGVIFNSWGSDPTPLPYNLWFDGDWKKPRFTDPRIVEGLSNYAALMKYGPPNIQSIDWNEATQLFSQGKVAFYVDASLFGPDFENPSSSSVSGKVGYLPLPRTEKGSMTGHWMWGLGVPANSAHKEAAWYFIQWATSKAIDPQIGAKTGGAPRLSTWSNPTYNKALSPDYVAAVRTAMKTSRPTGVFSDSWKEVGMMVVDAVQAIYGGTPAAKACADLQNKALKVLK